jgi:hypothetical protein
MINLIKKTADWICGLFVSSSPKRIVEAILRRKINWFDYEKLDSVEQGVYYQKIYNVLNNDAFQNEVNRLLADWIEEVAISDNEPNRDKMLRYSINGLKCLMERLESIRDPKKDEPTKDDLFNPI